MLATRKANLLAIFIKYVKSECKEIIAYLQGGKNKNIKMKSLIS